jgi:short-subunit dehydrogenase
VTRFEFAGAAAAITGAASGIGRALALELAARGCDLALADTDAAGLATIAAEVSRTYHRDVLVQQVDVAQRSQVQQFAQLANVRLPRLRILINNAGVALHGRFAEIGLEQLEWLMGVNFWGVVYGTHAFLPWLERQPRAHIVNLSSIFGVIAPPGNAAYCASKFAVRGFSESLRHELRAAHSSTRLSVVHPGGVKTNIVRHSRRGERLPDDGDGRDRERFIERFDRMARTSPAAAAARIARGIEHDHARILIGADARMMDWMQRLRPARYWPVMAAIAARFTRADP